MRLALGVPLGVLLVGGGSKHTNADVEASKKKNGVQTIKQVHESQSQHNTPEDGRFRAV